jgi:hypothetical protein
MAKRNVRARKRKPARKTARSLKAAPRARKKASAPKASRSAPKTARKASKSSRKIQSRPPARKRQAARSARPKPAALERERRRLPEEHEEEMVPSPPSTLNFSHKASQAESGRESLAQKRRLHTEGGEALTGGDLDADWNDAYATGEEAVGGDNPTPDQDVVEEIGRALGVEYEDAEELKGADKITERDRHRWEFDPASAEDYRDRNKKQ